MGLLAAAISVLARLGDASSTTTSGSASVSVAGSTKDSEMASNENVVFGPSTTLRFFVAASTKLAPKMSFPLCCFLQIACDSRSCRCAVATAAGARTSAALLVNRAPAPTAHRCVVGLESSVSGCAPAATASSRRSTNASLLPPGFTPLARHACRNSCSVSVFALTTSYLASTLANFPFAFVMRDPTAAAPRPGASALNRFAPSCCAARFSFHVRRARRSHGAFSSPRMMDSTPVLGPRFATG